MARDCAAAKPLPHADARAVVARYLKVEFPTSAFPDYDGVNFAVVASRGFAMRYAVAWMLGVPFSVIVLWYLVGHAACGR